MCQWDGRSVTAWHKCHSKDRCASGMAEVFIAWQKCYSKDRCASGMAEVLYLGRSVIAKTDVPVGWQKCYSLAEVL